MASVPEPPARYLRPVRTQQTSGNGVRAKRLLQRCGREAAKRQARESAFWRRATLATVRYPDAAEFQNFHDLNIAQQ